MKIIVALLLLIIGSICAHAAGDTDWQLSGHSSGVEIYSRTRAGSDIKEFKAVGEIDAAPQAVSSVLDDVAAYAHFMPYVVECRIISRSGDSLVSYQRLNPPLCSSRDYTLRVRHETRGASFLTTWEPANALGPAEIPGVVRVKTNEGSWLLEPARENVTRATYRIYTDSGGALPAFIANKANQVGIGKLFDAIRKQVKDPKYSAVR